jgi:hypothetical protein
MKLQFLHDQGVLSNPAGMVNNNEAVNAFSHSQCGFLSCISLSRGKVFLKNVNQSGDLFSNKRNKILLVIFLLMFSMAGFSQSNFSLGVSGGYDRSFNFLTGMKYSNSDIYPDFNLGVDGILNLGEKMRIRAELRYANMNYTREYNFDSQSSDRLEKSVLYISNLDINPRFDYKLIKAGNFDLYASAGLKLEFTLGDYERSTLANGDKLTTTHIENDYTKTQAGVVGGFIFKYNVNPSFGITLSPDYTCFFDKFYSKNDYILQRVGVNLGVEWKF